MATRKATLSSPPNDSRGPEGRPAKRAKVNDVNQIGTSSMELSNGMQPEDTSVAALLSEDEEETNPGQSNSEPRASDLYLDTVRHPMVPTQHHLHDL